MLGPNAPAWKSTYAKATDIKEQDVSAPIAIMFAKGKCVHKRSFTLINATRNQDMFNLTDDMQMPEALSNGLETQR